MGDRRHSDDCQFLPRHPRRGILAVDCHGSCTDRLFVDFLYEEEQIKWKIRRQGEGGGSLIKVFIRPWTKADGSWEPFLEEILRQDYGITEPVVERDEWGKPFLKNNPFFFNVSHAGEYVVIAVSERPVGVDIEGRRKIKDGMYRKVVRQEEEKLIGQDREWDFLRLWTLKESFVKAEGKGLRIPMKDYFFGKEEEKLFVTYGGRRAPWTFYIEETAAPGYVISVCGLEEEVRWMTEA